VAGDTRLLLATVAECSSLIGGESNVE